MSVAILAQVLAMSDDEIIAGPLEVRISDDGIVERAPRAQRRLQSVGHFAGLLIADVGVESDVKLPADFIPSESPESSLVTGLCSCSWNVEAFDDSLRQECEALHKTRGCGSSRRPWAFVRYCLLDVRELEHAFNLPVGFDDSDLCAPNALFDLMCETTMLHGSAPSLQEYLRRHAEWPMRILRIPWDTLDYLLSGDTPVTMRLTPLRLRTSPKDFLCGLPPQTVINSWRRRLAPAPGAQAKAVPKAKSTRSYDDILLELPPSAGHTLRARRVAFLGKSCVEVDPLHILRAISFSRF